MSNTCEIRLIRGAKYQRLRTTALRLLFTTGPLALLGGLWNWLSPDTFAPVLLPWSIITGVLVLVLIVVEFLKWPLPKYQVVLNPGSAEELLHETKRVDKARSFLAAYVKEHRVDAAFVSDATHGRLG